VTVLLSVGNEVLQEALIRALLAASHRVRLLAPQALDTASEWSAQVEPRELHPQRPASWRDAARGCEAAILVDQSVAGPGTGMSDRPSVDQLIAAAAAAGVPRLTMVLDRRVNLPANARIEFLSGAFPEGWMGIRTGVVCGSGHDPVTLLLLMMRSLPAIPMLDDSHVIQPIWRDDLANVAAASVSLGQARLGRVVELAGPETVSERDLYERLAVLIDRQPLRLPVPEFVGHFGARLAAAVRVIEPFEAAQLAFMDMEDARRLATHDVMTRLFDMTPTGLDEMLRRLVADLVEQLPSQGVGAVHLKNFHLVIRDQPLDAAGVLHEWRTHFRDVMPIEVGVESAVGDVEVTEGAVLTMALPGRGHVAVRAEEVTAHEAMLVTLRGHLLAGAIRLRTTDSPEGVAVDLTTCDAAADPLDWLALAMGASRVQDAHWRRMLQNLASRVRGTAGPVTLESRTLTAVEAAQADAWIRDVIQGRRTVDHEQLK